MAKKSDRTTIEAVLTELLADLPKVSRGIVRQIRVAVPEYSRVPLGEHGDHVEEQQVRIVTALLDGRQPNADDLKRAAALGRLRATQGVSVEGVIGAYHVGNREIWKLIDERADRGREFLPQLATLMWDSIQMMSTEIAAAHSSVSRARHTQDLTSRHRLVELLSREVVDPEAEQVARSLGFDVEADFVGGCVSAGQPVNLLVETLNQELGYLKGVSFASKQGSLVVVLAQGVPTTDLAEVLGGLEGAPRGGVGLSRTGLEGAIQSISDAGFCRRAADDVRPVRTFESDWWGACLVAQGERLAPIVEQRRGVVESNPRLVQTLEEFMSSGFSVAATAKVLHIHPNSVGYRLDRWHQLTGWDPRTFAGLNQSMLACVLLRSRANTSVENENY